MKSPDLGSYFDHNATTPLSEEVVEAMVECWRTIPGNPSSTHRFGVAARYAIEKARRQIARLLSARSPDEIRFTSGGTAANNLAIRGAAFHAQRIGLGNHLITSAAEHKAVLETCIDLRDRFGFKLTVLPVDSWGRVRTSDLSESLRQETVLVSLMMANNEVGSIQPIAEFGRIIREKTSAMFHCDGVQAVGRLPVQLDEYPVDLFSLSSHKFNGPKGIGVLYCRDETNIDSIQTGGGQEFGLIGGTENVAAIVGAAKALEIVVANQSRETTRLSTLREELWLQLEAGIPGIIRNSPEDGCLPGTLNLSIPGLKAQRIVAELDARGFAISTGSACNSQGEETSHVLQAMLQDPIRIASAVRISIGSTNKQSDIQALGEAFIEVCKFLFAQSGPETT